MRSIRTLTAFPYSVLFALSIGLPTLAPTQTVVKATIGKAKIKVTVPTVPEGYEAFVTPRSSCSSAGHAVGDKQPVPNDPDPFVVDLSASLKKGDRVCIVEDFQYNGGGNAPQDQPISKSSPELAATEPPDANCKAPYTDCYWAYSALGGLEQSDLSSQTNQTNGFAELFVRAYAKSNKNIWAQIRFLGAPNTSGTASIASAATDPSGTVTSSSLSTVGNAIDYVFGGEWDPANHWHSTDGKFSVGLILAFGATTPLSSQTATVAYAVPAYGSNECTQLLARVGPGNSNGYGNPLPGSKSITTTTSAPGSTPTTSPIYCSVQPIATSTTSTNAVTGVTTTTTTTGTQITNIAFAPEDRSSFLLKYYAGVRIIDRNLLDPTKRGGCYPDDRNALTDNCSRAITDIAIGQDQSITGGYLRRAVLRTNVTFPIRTGVYLYGSASLRLVHNKTLDPLILTQTPITTGTTTPADSVTIPSPSVFVLPLKQSDRDFYRVGIALDLSAVLPKLFKQNNTN